MIKEISVADYITEYLYHRGIDCVFEMIGGMSVRLIDSIYRHGDIKIISMHHEQSCAFAACGWAQIKRLPGVAIATSGPGAMNLMTGIATCYFDSIPAIFITGQVNQNELSTGKRVRQTGFQEMNVVEIARPVVKKAVQLENADDIIYILPRLFDLSLNGRQGPVLLDIPMNLQKAMIKFDTNEELCQNKEEHQPIPSDLMKFIEKLSNALQHTTRPLCLLGGGVKQSNSECVVNDFIHKAGIPAVYSLQGKGILSSDDELAVGLIGTYGNRWANYALSQSDVLIVLGSRMDIRQTGADIEGFVKNKIVFQIDIDNEEINNRVPVDFSLNMDLKQAMKAVIQHSNHVNIGNWLNEINDNKTKWPDAAELNGITGINPNKFLNELGAAATDIMSFVTDVGANQVWSAQSLYTRNGQTFLTSGSMGSMGYALPTAIGVALAQDNKKVIAICGDGGIQCNIQELELLKRLQLPVKVLILNNNSLGMVRQFQWEYFDSRFPGTVDTYGCPDFVAVASAYNIEGRKTNEFDEQTIDWFLDDTSPKLLEVAIDQATGIFPKMQFGYGLDKMIPEKVILKDE